jgi:DNA-binding GntR family transcriptional regulator
LILSGVGILGMDRDATDEEMRGPYGTHSDPLAREVSCERPKSLRRAQVPAAAGCRRTNEGGCDLGRRPGRTGKLSETVSRYIIGQLFDGSLQSGDRIERDEIARTLGISASPIQEALADLARDGIVVVQYQRGAFVATFDRSSVIERHEIYGHLNAIASARVAANATPEVIGELRACYSRMRRSISEPEVFDDDAWNFRRLINHYGAGPCLQSFFRGFSLFMPQAYRLTWPTGLSVTLRAHKLELEAIESGDVGAATDAVVRQTRRVAELVVRALEERGVFQPQKPRMPTQNTSIVAI